MLPSGRCRDILIIADDFYFRHGLEAYINEERKTNSSVNSVSVTEFIRYAGPESQLNDKLIMLSVKDSALFTQVIDKLNGQYWRIIFFFDVLPCESGSYRWGFTSKRNDTRTLIELLRSIDNDGQMLSRRKRHHPLGESVVRCLCHGSSISAIAREMGVSEKSVYREKLRMTSKYGLKHLNSIGLLVCRNLLDVAQFKKTDAL
ncbi:hypothetical protein [Enterobacter sp. MGH 16]|uniref:hypothetical protein n=1 Tax=Enterobacter cloacae complex TaxID=354276 RepID=UPI0003BE097D|nr:hypothetical protein [Enterobacter sp. MGH 16]ESN53164.1 hypothetical protein L362_00061 [Enterobacter sp. MGH 16]